MLLLVACGLSGAEMVILNYDIQDLVVNGNHKFPPVLRTPRKAGFLQHKVNNDINSLAVKSKANGLPKSPTILQLSVEVLGGMNGKNHLGCSRSRKFDSVIKGTAEGFNGNEMGIKSYPVGSEGRFGFSFGCPYGFLGLLGQSLSQSSGDPKAIPSEVDGRKISQGGRKILPLPKEVNEVLRSVMTKVKEILDLISFSLIKVGEENPRGSSHRGNGKVAMSLDHRDLVYLFGNGKQEFLHVVA